MGNAIIFGVLFTKNYKKIQHLAFNDKVKVIKAFIPEKVKEFIGNFLKMN